VGNNWLDNKLDSLKRHPVVALALFLFAVIGAVGVVASAILSVMGVRELIDWGPQTGPSADEVFSTLTNRNLTYRQRAEFVQSTTNSLVEWKVTVKSGERIWTNNPNSTITLWFFPKLTSGKAPLLWASYPPGATDVLSLKAGDKVEVACYLQYDEKKWKPQLVDCLPYELIIR